MGEHQNVKQKRVLRRWHFCTRISLQQEQRWLLERETCVRNSSTIPLGSSSASPRLRHPLTSNGIGFMTGETGRLDSTLRIASFQASNPDISALLPLAGRSVS